MVASVVGLADRPNMFATTPAVIIHGQSQSGRWSTLQNLRCPRADATRLLQNFPKRGDLATLAEGTISGIRAWASDALAHCHGVRHGIVK